MNMKNLLKNFRLTAITLTLLIASVLPLVGYFTELSCSHLNESCIDSEHISGGSLEDMVQDILSYGSKSLRPFSNLFKSGVRVFHNHFLKILTGALLLQNGMQGVKAAGATNLNQNLTYKNDREVVQLQPIVVSLNPGIMYYWVTIVPRVNNSGLFGRASSTLRQSWVGAQGSLSVVNDKLSDLVFEPALGKGGVIYADSKMVNYENLQQVLAQGIIQFNPFITTTKSVTTQMTQTQSTLPMTMLSMNFPTVISNGTATTFNEEGSSFAIQASSLETTNNIQEIVTSLATTSSGYEMVTSSDSISTTSPNQLTSENESLNALIGGGIGGAFGLGLVVGGAVIAVKRGWCGKRNERSSDQQHRRELDAQNAYSNFVVVPKQALESNGCLAAGEKNITHYSNVPVVQKEQETPYLTTLHSAALSGNLSAIETLLELDVGVNSKDEDGYTALHRAAQAGHKDVCLLLLKHGADPSIRTADDLTAAELARRTNQEELRAIFS